MAYIHCCTNSEHMSRDHAMHEAVTYKRIKTIENFLSMRPQFLWVYQRDNWRWEKKSDLQAFQVLSQHPKWGCQAGKPIESVFYCFYKIILGKTYVFNQLECLCYLNNYQPKQWWQLLGVLDWWSLIHIHVQMYM